MAKKKVSRTARKATAKAKKPKMPSTAGGSVSDAIHRLDAAFMKAADARDAGALVKAFYAPGAVLMPPNHPAVEGHADIQAFLQGLMDAGFKSIKLETTAVESAGNLAYGRGRYVLTMSPPSGSAMEDTGKYIVVYRRSASAQWRAVADIFNSDQAPPQ
jgi:ketosteroid isomerase-like protein